MTRSHARTGRPAGRPPTTKAKASVSSASRITSGGDVDVDDIPTPPDSLDEDGLFMWYKLYAENKHITSADFFVVKTACEVYQEHEMLRRLLSAGGGKRSVVHPNKTTGESALLRDLRKSRLELNGYMSTLAITPTDRARMNAEEDAAQVAFMTLVAQQKELQEQRRSQRAAATESGTEK